MTDVVVDICVSVGVLALGLGIGRRALVYGEAVHNVFRRKAYLWGMLGSYVFLIVVLLHMPHVKIWPLEWRLHGLNATWLMMRALLVGACGMAIALSGKTSRPQVLAIMLIGIIGVSGFWGLERYLMSPIYPTLDSIPSSHSIVKQTSESSCAPAALATVLKQWHLQISEAEIAQLAQTSRMGTSMPHLIFAAQQLGMEGVELEPSWETIQRINRPGVLSVWVQEGDRRLPHAVALLGMSHKTAIIADPASGQAFHLSRQELESMWRHEYVPIVRPSDVTLSERQVLGYLARTESAVENSDLALSVFGDGKRPQKHRISLIRGAGARSEEKEHKRGRSLFDRRRLSGSTHLSRFQQQHTGLRRSGNLDSATILALQGPFIQDGPTLTNRVTNPMTMADYHHLKS